MKKRVNEAKIRVNTAECDEISRRFWSENKEKRKKTYLEWLQKVKQTADIIEKNQCQNAYILGASKLVACTNDSSGERLGNVGNVEKCRAVNY